MCTRVKELVEFIIKNNLMDSNAELVVLVAGDKKFLDIACVLDEVVKQNKVVLLAQ